MLFLPSDKMSSINSQVIRETSGEESLLTHWFEDRMLFVPTKVSASSTRWARSVIGNKLKDAHHF